MRASCIAGAVSACSALVGLLFSAGPVVAAPVPTQTSDRVVVHEWGTFTSFAGSDGVPVGFRPDNSNLPDFVYFQDGDPGTKERRLSKDGTISMETPVLYFYTDRERRLSVRVDFPRGWITEWYPFAAAAPSQRGRQPRAEGQSIRWDVKLLAGETVRLPHTKQGNHYYEARETDSVPLQTEVVSEKQGDPELRGGTLIQREKFLFYRGVGNFPPQVSVRTLGNGTVRLRNAAGSRVRGLLLVTVQGPRVGFKKLDDLDAGAEATATLPTLDLQGVDAGEVMVKELTAAGLFEKEARAMVRTWDSAWFGEDGTRLLYLVPRARTDELLPLTIDPKPNDVVRVLVGRHDFLTPEQEAAFDRQAKRAAAGQPPLDADKDLLRLGRFGEQARHLAEKRTGNAPK
jgi:hypothetical protein